MMPAPKDTAEQRCVLIYRAVNDRAECMPLPEINIQRCAGKRNLEENSALIAKRLKMIRNFTIIRSADIMPWNPEIYDRFKAFRYKPFFDLMDMVSEHGLYTAVDIGCGTGEQTAILAKKFDAASFLGIDPSAEMLEDADGPMRDGLRFQRRTAEQFAMGTSQWDLVFSNAALQWSDHHDILFPQLIAKLNPGGQFAVQMPFQQENLLNKILFDIVTEPPFSRLLNGYARISPVCSIDTYAAIMFGNGLQDLDLSIRVYPMIATSASELYDFISGSALIPYMERLDVAGQALLRSRLIKDIERHFPEFPAIYSFKRLLLYGVKGRSI